MSDTERTPTTEEVREAYQGSGEGVDFKRVHEEQGREFDRWVADLIQAERHEAWESGYLAGIDDTANAHRGADPTRNPHEETR